jgi:hypothetical protein
MKWQKSSKKMTLKTNIFKILTKQGNFNYKILIKIYKNQDQTAFSLKCNKTNHFFQKMVEKTSRNNIFKENSKNKIK